MSGVIYIRKSLDRGKRFLSGVVVLVEYRAKIMKVVPRIFLRCSRRAISKRRPGFINLVTFAYSKSVLVHVLGFVAQLGQS